MTRENVDERRKSPRTEILLRVAYQEPQDLLADYITNLGQGGIFIHTDLPFANGQQISFSLSFPGLLVPVHLTGIVRWRREYDPETPEKTAGLGVEFVFEDPRQERQILDFFHSLSEELVPLEIDQSRSFQVLLVEDNDFVQELFDYAIRRFHLEHIGTGGIEIFHASDGKQALQRLQEFPVDLAIVDHYLPGITGCELIRCVRQDPKTRQIPILVISTGGEKIRRQAYECGADLFLDKPVLHRQLISTLTVLLRMRQASNKAGQEHNVTQGT